MIKHFPNLRVIVITGLLLAACSSAPSSAPPDADTGPEVPSGPQPTPTDSPLTENDYSANPISDRDYSDLNIVTLLPRDAIPAINNPSFLSVSEADQEYAPDELVIGVEFNGDARAYSVGLLSSHEIVNDTVGGAEISVTW